MKQLIILFLVMGMSNLTAQNKKVPDINCNIPTFFPGKPAKFPPGDKLSNPFTGGVEFLSQEKRFGTVFPKGGVVYGNMDSDLDLEIIYSVDTQIFCINTDGSNVLGWPISVSEQVEWVPSLGDITGNGEDEVVFTSTTDSSGKIYAYNKSGNIINGFPINIGKSPFIATLGDIDSDYDYEIVLGSNKGATGGELLAFEGDGTLVSGFPYDLGEKIAGHLAIGDINNSFGEEIVVITEKKLWAFDYQGNLLTGFPFVLGGTELFSYSSPILSDLDNDLNYEIVVGSHDENNGYVYTLNNNGSLLTGWPQVTTNWIYASPIPVDINNDGNLEIVVGDFNQSDNPISSLYLFKIDGTLLKSINNLYGITSITPVDLDNDGLLEFLIDANSQYGIEGKYFALSNSLNPIDGWPLEVIGNTVFSPAILGDLNGNGKLEMMSLTTDFLSHSAFSLFLESNILFDPQNIINPFFQINKYHNGYIKNNFTTEIAEDNKTDSFKVYPNPSKGLFNLESNSDIKNISVFDISGKIILEQTGASAQEPLFLTNIPNGVYFLSVSNKTNTFFTKIIKN